MDENIKIQRMNNAINYLDAENKKRIETIQKINNELEEFEPQRKEDLRNMFIFEVLCLLFGIGLCYGGINMIIHTNNFFLQIFAGCLIFATFGIFILFCIGPSSWDKDFKNKLKESPAVSSIYKLLNLTKTDFNKNQNWQQLLKKSKLFSAFNIATFDDGFHGAIDGVTYNITECELFYETKGSKNNSIYTAFKGVVICIDYNKKIGAETLITSKNDININNSRFSSDRRTEIICVIAFMIAISLFIAFKTMTTFSSVAAFNFPTNAFSIGLFVQSVGIVLLVLLAVFVLFKTRKMQKAKMEDVEFEKLFNIQTKNQIEARYLITPAFMERFKNLETAFGTNKLKCSFFEDKVMFAISTNKDLFEFGSLYHSLKNSKAVENCYYQIKSIQDMVEHFKLNEKTGL